MEKKICGDLFMKKTISILIGFFCLFFSCCTSNNVIEKPSNTFNPSSNSDAGNVNNNSTQKTQENSAQFSETRIENDIVGKIVETGGGHHWTFIKGEPRIIEILEQNNDSLKATSIIINLATCEILQVPGFDVANNYSGKLRLHYEKIAGEWTLFGNVENINFGRNSDGDKRCREYVSKSMPKASPNKPDVSPAMIDAQKFVDLCKIDIANRDLSALQKTLLSKIDKSDPLYANTNGNISIAFADANKYLQIANSIGKDGYFRDLSSNLERHLLKQKYGNSLEGENAKQYEKAVGRLIEMTTQAQGYK